MAQLDCACARTTVLTRRFAPTWSAGHARAGLAWPTELTTLLRAPTWRGRVARIAARTLDSLLAQPGDTSPRLSPTASGGGGTTTTRIHVTCHPSVLHYAGGDQPWEFLIACRLRGWQVTLDDQAPYGTAVLMGRSGRRTMYRLRLTDLSHADMQRIRLGDWSIEGLATAMSDVTPPRRRRQRHQSA